jgi:thiol-disulfide isomerase/thioredoxin
MKGNKSSFWLGVVTGAICLLATIFIYIRYFSLTEESLRETAQILAPPPVPSQVPVNLYDLTLASLLDSATVNIKSAKDKVIFLNFWATWCGPCVAEFPNIEKLKETFKGKQVAFYIISEEPLNTINSFAAKRKFNLPFYKLNMLLPPVFNGSSIPRTYIISNGKIILSHEGAANWNDASIINLINKELSVNK